MKRGKQEGRREEWEKERERGEGRRGRRPHHVLCQASLVPMHLGTTNGKGWS